MGRLLACGGLCLLGGCMLPVYQQPQGFSSTYYRHLQSAAEAQAAMMQTPPGPTPLGAAKPDPQVPKPIETADDEDNSNEDSARSTAGSWWSWIQRPLTFGSKSDSNSTDDSESTRR